MHILQTIALVVALALVAFAFIETVNRQPPIRVVLVCVPAALLAIFQYAGTTPLETPPDVTFGAIYGAIVVLISVSVAQRRRPSDDRPAPPIEH